MKNLENQKPILIEGLNKDVFVQNGLTFALNTVKSSHEGQIPNYQSEPGNTLVASLPAGYTLISSPVFGQDNEIYLFSTNNIDSEIGVFQEGTYTTLVNNDCLNFNTNYPITAEIKVFGCDINLYWSDYLNPDRFFTVTKPNDFKTSGIWDCDKFKLNPTLLPVNIDLLSVNESGGSLEVGSYFFQIKVLDKNRNVIWTSDITPQVPIISDVITSNFWSSNGDLNYPQFDQAVGGINPTTKSITLGFSNLPLEYSYIQISVLKKTTNNNNYSGFTIGELIPITSTTQQWIFSGYNANRGDFPIDVSSTLIDNIIYESSYVMEQVQGRLLRANLVQTRKDYSNYQSFASQITSKWVSERIESENPTKQGNCKNPTSYWYKTTFQGDEVIADAIQYLHEDGEWSPAFLLVGRASTTLDRTLLTVVANNITPTSTEVWKSDVEHLNSSDFTSFVSGFVGSTIERWKVFNTASITSSTATESEGEFGFYESGQIYPNIFDCENFNIWGTLANQKIRLKRFPDRKLVPHLSNDGKYIYPLGIKYDNIIYPNPTVIGHRFLTLERTEADKTVLDSGWSTQRVSTTASNIIDAEAHLYNFGSNIDPEVNTNFFSFQRYNSANTLYNNKLFTFNHFKVNNAFEMRSNTIPNFPGDCKHVIHDGIDDTSCIIYVSATNRATIERTNILEKDSIIIEPYTENIDIVNGITDIVSNDAFTGDSFSYTNYPLPDVSTILGSTQTPLEPAPTNAQWIYHNFYVYKKSNIQPYQNIFNRQFKYLHLNPEYTTTPKKYFGGDSIITNTHTFRFRFVSSNPAGTERYFVFPFYKHHFEEQQINVALRHEGTELPFQYFRPGKTDEFVISKIRELGRVGGDITPEYYKYNTDYTVDKFGKSYLPIPTNYNYCPECYGIYPNRIVFSPKSFSEEITDNYRVNKTNDYIEIPTTKGKITGLKYRNNQLFVHCEDTTFIIQPNPQVIATNQSTAYLSTGDFLSIPPQELIQTDIGYAGCQNKQHYCTTPNGHSWVDQKQGKIFLFTDQLEQISNKGLMYWLKENLPSEMQKTFYNVNKEDYPYLNTTHNFGIGLILYYDPYFQRLILSKKDYKPINLVSAPTPTGTNEMYFNNGLWQVWTNNNPVLSPNFSNTNFFENKSWTLSYDFNNWVSYHSYIPYNAFYDNRYMYTMSNNNIYKHLEKQSYQNFYNVKYDMIIEYVDFDIVADRLSSIHYVGYSLVWDDINKQWLAVDNTFNKVVCYNYNQSTGLQDIVLQNQHTNPYANITFPTYSKFAIKTDQNYKIAGLYDMSIGQPVQTKDWNQVKLYQGYIDEVVNTSQINFSKNPYQHSMLWDKFIKVRLFYKPNEDSKKIIILNLNNQLLSIR